MKHIKIKKNSLYTVLSILVLKSILEIGYIIFVNKHFEYSGFLLEVNTMKFIESTILVVLLIILLRRLENRNRPSKIVIYILFFNLFLPISVLYWVMDESRTFFFLAFLFLVLLIIITSKFKLLTLPKINESKKMTFLVLAIMTISVYSFLIVTGGISRINFNLLDVYETRSGYAANNNMIFGYLIPWQAHIVNIFFMVYGFYSRKKGLIMSAVVLQIFLFLMTNFKSYLFAPLVILGAFMVFKDKNKKKSLLIISSGISFLLVLSYLVYFINKEIVLLSIFLRRLFFVPARLHYIYYDFYSQNEKFYLSTSLFKGILNSPHEYGPVKLVAMQIFGRDFSPNVGVIGDAYLNFGAIGIVFFAFILGFYLLLLDSVTKDMNMVYAISLIAIPAMSLVNAALFTTFLTHGLFFVLLLLWFSNTIFEDKLGLRKGF